MPQRAPQGRDCPAGKHRYRDRVGALMALADTLRAGSGARNEVRAYKCHLCSGWHLTSKALYRPPRLDEVTPGAKAPYSPPRLEQEPGGGQLGDAAQPDGTRPNGEGQ